MTTDQPLTAEQLASLRIVSQRGDLVLVNQSRARLLFDRGLIDGPAHPGPARRAWLTPAGEQALAAFHTPPAQGSPVTPEAGDAGVEGPGGEVAGIPPLAATSRPDVTVTRRGL